MIWFTAAEWAHMLTSPFVIALNVLAVTGVVG
jgi:hypothetical protein